MASWVDEVIGMWDPQGGSGSGAGLFGCLGGVILGGAALILGACILDGLWGFLMDLGEVKLNLPEFTSWDWAEVLAEFPNIMLAIFRFIGDLLYAIMKFFHDILG